ncbi:zinc-dependent alcohol dehydrogenase [Caproiciproducens sp. R1]|uniref:zinc-dependent alcohol dehydrogenase n=1 Tax=Caproiciproducens sp. R1 TaxID=3435000 RepID=UPI004034DED3
MKEALLKDVERIEVEDVQENSTISDDSVLVRMKVVTICGSDVNYFRAKTLPHHLAYPLVLGHEAAGVITRAGKNITRLKVGDRVALEPGNWCGHCRYCRSGQYNFCERLSFLASKGTPGALKEFISWPGKCVFRLPDSLSFEEGALLEPLSVAYSAIEKLPEENCSVIAVLGAGSIGMLIGKLLSVMFPDKKVYLSDIFPEKRDIGVQMDFKREQFLIAGKYDGSTVPALDAVIDTTGNTEAVNTFIGYLHNGGTLVTVGVSDQPLGQTFKQIVYKGLRVIPSYRYTNTYPKLISLLQQEKIDIGRIITHRFSFEETQKAFEKTRDILCMKVAVQVDK